MAWWQKCSAAFPPASPPCAASGAAIVGLRNLKSTNEELTRQLEEAQLALQEQRALADRTRNLEKLLDLRDRSNLKTAAAEIIAAGASPDFRTLTIDKGTSDGVGADMAVIAPAGVVGRVVMPSRRAAKVQLLIDRNAAAGALVERSRAQGVVTGTGDERLSMEYVSEVADVIVGDLVVTSGIDGIYPKGYVIGRDRIDGEGGRGLQADYGQARRRFHQPRGSAGRSDADPGPRSGRGERRVRAAGIILAVAAALALQTTLARYIRGSVALDLVLVVVVYVALTSGPVTGLLTGTFAGLVQDAMARGVIGIGGLAKTLVGFLAGIVGTQFIVAQPLPRFVVFFGATLLHGLVFIGLYVLLNLRHFESPYAAVVGQAAGNAAVGVMAFQLGELLPGAVERRRAAKGRLRR